MLKTFEKELVAEGLAALNPLNRVDISEGVALPDEVTKIVTNRSGSVLSASTILKSDFFSNLQKMTLPESVAFSRSIIRLVTDPVLTYRRIDGSPNFRRVPLMLHPISSRSGPNSPDSVEFVAGNEHDNKWVCGSGMPTVQG